MVTTSSGRLHRHSLLLATTILVSGLASPTTAQQAPEEYNVDSNGFDLLSSDLFSGHTDISIGTGDAELALTWAGLSQIYSYGPSLRHSNYDASWTFTHPGLNTNDVTLQIGGTSKALQYSTTTGKYTNIRGEVEDFNTSRYIDRNGVEYKFEFGSGTVQNNDYVVRATRIIRPNGSQVKVHWTSFQELSYDEFGFPIYTYFDRIQSVTNSYGYQLKINYLSNVRNNYQYYDAWLTPASVVALNNAVEPCDPNVDTCAVASTWPKVDYAMLTNGSGVAVSGPGPSSQTFTTSGYSVNGNSRSSINGSLYGSVGYTRSATVTKNGINYTYYKYPGVLADGAYSFITKVTDASGNSEYYKISESLSKVLEITAKDGGITRFSYDASGRTTRVTFPEGNYTSYTYDARGNVTEKRSVSKTPGTPPDIVETAAFSANCTNLKICNLPLSTTDARGNTTDYTYDPTHGGVLSVTAPAPVTNGTRSQTRYSYDTRQAYYKTSGVSIVASGVPTYVATVISSCQTGSNCEGTADEVKTTVDYGPQTNGVANSLSPASVTSGAGNGSLVATTAYTYNELGDPTYVDGPLAGNSDTTRTIYDAARRSVGVIGPDPDGAGALLNRATRLTYNADDQVTLAEAGTTTGQSDASWAAFTPLQAVVSEYDSNARKTTDKVQSGGTTYAVTQYSYDVLGRSECVATRMNSAIFGSLPSSACTLGTAGSFGPDRITKTGYNAAGQTETVTNAFGTADQAREMLIYYTANGKTQRVYDANNNVTTYYYDGQDRLAKQEMPSPTTPYTGNAADFEQYTYDANGNVTQRRLRDGQVIGLTYDNLNRLTAKDRPNVAYWETDQSYAYDNLGRLKLASDSNGRQLSFGYDALGRTISQGDNWYTFGNMAFQYDLAGRRTRSTWADGFYAQYDHLVTGEVSAIRENGATSGVGVLGTYAYDNLGRMTALTRGNGVVTSYAFDPVSRLTSLANDLAGSAHDVTTTFAHNPASQIASSTRTNDTYAWTGHYNVNRPYTVNGLNQLTAAGGTSLGYDGRGNLTSSGSMSYGYTSENQLATATGVSGIAYDPVGRLFNFNAEAGINTTLTYDGMMLTSETNQASSALLRRYVHGPGSDDPLVWYEGSGTSDRRWLIPDERGSVVAVTDASGVATTINRYDEYGIPASTNAGRFGYTGQTWLPELGMWYYKARIYSATLGRFMQTDPIGYADDMNLYAYVGGDPVNKKDASGTSACYGAPPLNEEENEIGVCGGYSDNSILGWLGFSRLPGTGVTFERDLALLRANRLSTNNPNLIALPQKIENFCPKGDYTTYSLGGSGTVALFVGVNVSVSFGVSVPKDGNIFGLQYFGSGQAAGMLGVGAFAGAGATFSKGTNSGPMKNFDHGGFGYGEADAGWGFAVGGSAQGNRGSSSGSVGLPIPKVGAGYGAYAGVGAGYGATVATTPFCALGNGR